MKLSNILGEARIVPRVKVASKKAAITKLSQHFVEQSADLEADELVELFFNRERLGSTAIGHGIAIPHIRAEDVSEPMACLLQLQQGIDFDAPDQQPVDLVIGLIVPVHAHDAHLRLLADIAKQFSDQAFCQSIRRADDAQTIHDLLFDHERSLAVA